MKSNKRERVKSEKYLCKRGRRFVTNHETYILMSHYNLIDLFSGKRTKQLRLIFEFFFFNELKRQKDKDNNCLHRKIKNCNYRKCDAVIINLISFRLMRQETFMGFLNPLPKWLKDCCSFSYCFMSINSTDCKSHLHHFVGFISITRLASYSIEEDFLQSRNAKSTMLLSYVDRFCSKTQLHNLLYSYTYVDR